MNNRPGDIGNSKRNNKNLWAVLVDSDVVVVDPCHKSLARSQKMLSFFVRRAEPTYTSQFCFSFVGLSGGHQSPRQPLRISFLKSHNKSNNNNNPPKNPIKAFIRTPSMFRSQLFPEYHSLHLHDFPAGSDRHVP